MNIDIHGPRRHICALVWRNGAKFDNRETLFIYWRQSLVLLIGDEVKCCQHGLRYLYGDIDNKYVIFVFWMCFWLMYEHLFTNESDCRRFEIDTQ